MSERTVLASAPFPLVLRNFVPTGLAAELERRFGVKVRFVSPYQQSHFTDGEKVAFANHTVTSHAGVNGIPVPSGVTALDRAIKSIHLTGFALEYPEGSLQNLELSRRIHRSAPSPACSWRWRRVAPTADGGCARLPLPTGHDAKKSRRYSIERLPLWFLSRHLVTTGSTTSFSTRQRGEASRAYAPY